MFDPVVYVVAAVIVGVLLLFVTKFRKSKTEDENEEEGPRRPAGRVPPRNVGDMPAAAAARRRAGRMRMARRTARDDSDEDMGYEDEDIFDNIAQPEGKIGAKKLRKLQEKAEKKSAREAMEQEREERKERERMLEEQRKKEEARQKAEEEAREEEERKRREEEEKREYEEYLKLKETFTVDEEGTEDVLTEQESQSLLGEFVQYIKDMKVVMLEDLAGHFKIKTQDVIDRITELTESGRLTGVIDDRGKFIYISMEEYEAVAKFIKQRGRVSITELAESSNQLINLNPDNKDTLHKLLGDSQIEEVSA